ncbi:hypothetical protein [Streptomyces toxytricini]|uniref:hypothetical protein n=1 Tax=Streptomyces toxytricini TaxID=67369 RepID=UPI00343620C0
MPVGTDSYVELFNGGWGAVTRTGAVSAPVADLGDWIAQVVAPRNGDQVSLLAAGGGTMWSQVGDLG